METVSIRETCENTKFLLEMTEDLIDRTTTTEEKCQYEEDQVGEVTEPEDHPRIHRFVHSNPHNPQTKIFRTRPS